MEVPPCYSEPWITGSRGYSCFRTERRPSVSGCLNQQGSDKITHIFVQRLRRIPCTSERAHSLCFSQQEAERKEDLHKRLMKVTAGCRNRLRNSALLTALPRFQSGENRVVFFGFSAVFGHFQLCIHFMLLCKRTHAMVGLTHRPERRLCT